MSRRPNIVLIMADDMGYSDIGCFGGEISTPNIDRLAKKGVRFTHFYNNGVCMPTRASLLTGLYPRQVGAAASVRLKPDNNVTLAEVLRSAGYRTLMSGKWHNGNSVDELPINRGFDRYYGLLSGCSNYFNPGLKREGEPEPAHKSSGNTRPWGIDHEVIHPFTPDDPDFYATDAFTDKAVAFLESCGQDDTPFFLYLAYTAPHFPIQARPEDIEKYRGRYMTGWDEIRKNRFERMVEMGIADPVWDLSPRDELSPSWDSILDKETWDLKMAVYAAMIDRMDQGIGRVMEKLRSLGKEEDTLVIFLSDNGGCGEHIDRTPDVPPGPVNSYCTVDAPWANASNTPFRRYKVFDHEGGISTPLVLSWPRVIKDGGRICHDVGHVIDIMPTFVEVSGAGYPSEYNDHPVLPMEGRSLMKSIAGKAIENGNPLFWEFRGCKAARIGDWKIVTQGPARRHVNIEIEPGHEDWELYNMRDDRCELRNSAKECPDKVDKMSVMWREWQSRCTRDADEYDYEEEW